MNSLGKPQSKDPSWGDCIEDVLLEAHEAGEPYLEERELARRILHSGRKQTDGRTPERSVSWALNNDSRGRFRRVSRGRYALAIHKADSVDTQGEEGAGDSDVDCERWDRYLEDVRRYVESGRLDSEEVDYKLRIGEALSEAREAVLNDHSRWPDLVKRGVRGDHHPMAWRQASALGQWIDDDPEAALEALRALWTDNDRSTSERIRTFSALYPWKSTGADVPTEGVLHPKYGTNGRGVRLRTISVLLMALDPSSYPPFMRSVFSAVYRRLGFDGLSSRSAEEVQYSYALRFLDELIRRARLHGLKRPSSRLEAQSVVWGVRGDEKPLQPDPGESLERPCWFVGASFGEGTEDQTDRFIREGIWEHHGEKADLFVDQVKSIQPGDRIAIKATYNRKSGLPFDNQGEFISTMAIKATGTVNGNPGDGRRLRVAWEPVSPPREWYFYTSIPRVWQVSRDAEVRMPWAATALIDFAFEDAGQDYDRFLRYFYPQRYDNDQHEERPEPAPNGGASPARAKITKLAAELLYDEAHLRKIETLLDDKRQVIFQGPPGTGKTFAARELARFLAGSDDRVTLVQFHPSYAYEDFVQGYRPTLTSAGQAGFELRDGPLVTAAAAARGEPHASHFLIIDEINRGNLAKVLGELYFLLEYRDAGIGLQYSAEEDEPFSLPENLYIIGTMNTADRSIALVDLALRRRFHFVEFHPDKPPVAGLLERWLKRNAEDMAWVVDLVKRANAKLDDRQAAIGPTYFMKKDLSEEKVRLIWEHNVLPYIEEHLYGETDRLAEFDLEKLRHGPASEDAATDSPGQDATTELDGAGDDESGDDAHS